jgi:hemerythrin superfamily protein
VESSRSFWPVWKASDFQVVENKGLTETTIRDNWIPKIFQNQTVRRTFDCQDTCNRTYRGEYTVATPRDYTSPPEDAIEMLKADHQKVRELFQDYESAQDQKAKSKIAQQVFVELETHAQLEETVFYPAFRQEADREGKQLVAESLQEHQRVKDLIGELRELDADDETFDVKFHELMENVEHHVEEEESEMLPEAEMALAEQAEELMDEMHEVKRQLLSR